MGAQEESVAKLWAPVVSSPPPAPFKKKFSFFEFCVQMCLCVALYTYMQSLQGPKEAVGSSGAEVIGSLLSCLPEVLRTDLGSSAGAACSLKG